MRLVFGISIALSVAGTLRAADDPLIPFLGDHCLRCHDAEKAKGGLDLDELGRVADFAGDLVDWRLVREKLRHREMPPEDEPRPDEGEIDLALRALDTHLAVAIAALPQEPGRVTARRLNRREYGATIADLFGIDLPIEDLLPPDDVGDGFDHIGDVLGLPPMLLEKYIGIAEELARDAVIVDGDARVPTRVVEGAALGLEGGGSFSGRFQHLYSHGVVWMNHRFPRDGTYRLRFEAFGQQAGPEVVKFAVRVDAVRRTVIEVPATQQNPGTYELETQVARGTRQVGLEFINDYYRPDDPDPSQRDRNAGVLSIAVEGPLEGLAPTEFQTALWRSEPEAADWRSALAEILPALLRRAWRRSATEEQITALLDLVARATPEGSAASAHLRTAIVAVLVSPRFLFRLEEDPPGASAGTVRDLDGFERATRLSYFLWASTPDAALLSAAAAGELDSAAGVRRAAGRLFSDGRARSISEAFVPQWLQFAHLLTLRPDRERFPAVDERLLTLQRQETIALFEHIRREGRPLWELIDADYTFLNERLAEHYGIPGVRGDELRRVAVGAPRGGGLLAQGSILTATSNPNRTSPVLRGKWVLEALLDAPPPPPPPGAGSLPDPGKPGSELPLREQLALHRRDPTCAGCHRRMDALGFALEEFDAVGGWRPGRDSATIDCRGELPDGRAVVGVAGVRALLSGDRGFLRALSKNMLVYALGRGLTVDDEPALERLIARLEREPTLSALVDEIVGLDAFLGRRVPAAEDGEQEGVDR